MPTYEYQCQDCGREFDYLQSMSEPHKTKCEECGGKLTKLLSAGSGLIFKGSGFYITDYKKSGGATDSGESKKTESPAKTETEGKAEGKPVEKAPKPSGESKEQ